MEQPGEIKSNYNLNKVKQNIQTDSIKSSKQMNE